jgi:high affinity choline transporter 7
MSAFAVALLLRLGGGEPLFGLPPFLPYPELFRGLLRTPPDSWYEQKEGVRVMLFPFKTLAFASGMVLLPLVSRLTTRWDAPRPLRAPAALAVDEVKKTGLTGACPT